MVMTEIRYSETVHTEVMEKTNQAIWTVSWPSKWKPCRYLPSSWVRRNQHCQGGSRDMSGDEEIA